ncbi:tetratricopeptide repeat protein [bacterium]|nr:tetratricopeptide repeat protein [bacterium]
MMSEYNKYLSILCMGFIGYVLLAGPVLAVDNADPSSISDLWEKQVDFFNQTASSSENDDAYMDIVEYLRDHGITRSKTLSSAYVYLGLKARSQKHYSDAQWAFNTALEVHPDYMSAADAAVKNSFRIGIGEVISALLAKTGIYLREYTGYYHGLIHAGNIALILQIAIALLAAAVIIAIFFNQFPLIVTELHSHLPFIPDQRITALLIVCVFALLFLTPIGIFGILTIWLVLDFLFSSRNHRKTLWITWILLIFTIPLTLIHAFSIKIYENEYLRVLEYTKTEGYTEPIINELNQMLESGGRERKAKIHFLLGLMYKRGGYYIDARKHYQKFTELDSRDSRGYINLGNIAFIEERIKTATECYRKAEKLDPRNPIIYHNLSKAYLGQFRFDESRDMQNRASRLDPEMIERFSANQSSNPLRMMVDAGIPSDWQKEEIIVLLNNTLSDHRRFWRPKVTDLSITHSALFWLVVSILVFVLRFLAQRFKLSRFCLKCGKAMKPDEKAGGTDYMCVSCHMIYFKKSTISVATQGTGMLKKPESIDWNKLFHRGFSCVVPGAGRIYSGKTVSGLLLIIPWTLLISTLVAGKYLILLDYRIPNVSSYIGITTVIFLLLIDYGISILWGFKEEEI